MCIPDINSDQHPESDVWPHNEKAFVPKGNIGPLLSYTSLFAIILREKKKVYPCVSFKGMFCYHTWLIKDISEHK